jgi:hypothetical protein
VEGGHLASEARRRSRAGGRGWAQGSKSSNPGAARLESCGHTDPTELEFGE